MRIRSFPLRTLSVYGLLRYVPRNLRPTDHRLFQWQDEHFDKSVAKHLEQSHAIHGMPGQCLQTFKAAKALGIQTVLNHATGPSASMAESLQEEYARVGMNFSKVTRFDEAYRRQEEEEMALADIHCVASTIVVDQLGEKQIPHERIWRVPYGADDAVFFPSESTQQSNSSFRIIFAGQLTLRKGVRFLLEALAQSDQSDWTVDLYGGASEETESDLNAYQGAPVIRKHGAVSQEKLADAFRSANLLVLPSLEEGFGLVVAQALSCGLPCLVSEATGAKDLITHRKNGSIIPARDADSLAIELEWWSQNRCRVSEIHSWETAARRLADYHFSRSTLAHCA